MLVWSRLLVGLLLLVFGRRLYWLFVAAVGFLYGIELAPRFFPEQSQTMIILIALGLALVCALLAVVATKIALGLTGFVAAGGVAALVLQHLAIENGVVVLAVYLIAGLIGAVLCLLLFDAALVVLSSLAGSCLVVLSAERLLEIPSNIATVLIILLAALGIVIQARPWRRGQPTR